MKIVRITLYAAFPNHAGDNNPQHAGEEFEERLREEWFAYAVEHTVEEFPAEPEDDPDEENNVSWQGWLERARTEIANLKPGQVGIVEVIRDQT